LYPQNPKTPTHLNINNNFSAINKNANNRGKKVAYASYYFRLSYFFSLISRPYEETRRVFCISKEKEKARNHLK
jgi:hypothetical protein